jgi:hypothetical protein
MSWGKPVRKVPTVFKRDPEDMRKLLPEVNDGCQWVLDGEGTPTRKLDGTCCMFDGSHWWARREVKPGKQFPAGFIEVECDDTTGKTVGWEPMEQSGFAKWHADALEHEWEDITKVPSPPDDIGSYELCGPKVQGNPEGFEHHVLIRHADAEHIPSVWYENYEGKPGVTFEGLRSLLSDAFPYEGIVWHHADGRYAKLKVRDFQQ